MQHVSYAESVFATDERLAELLLEYARLLARANSADTVTVPGRIDGGAVEPISVLVGPASQITSWNDGVPFGQDVSAEVADLEHRIRARTAPIPPSQAPDPPGGIDEFDELA